MNKKKWSKIEEQNYERRMRERFLNDIYSTDFLPDYRIKVPKYTPPINMIPGSNTEYHPLGAFQKSKSFLTFMQKETKNER